MWRQLLLFHIAEMFYLREISILPDCRSRINFMNAKMLLKNKKWFYAEMMGLIGAGNNPMVGMTVAVAVAVEEAMK